MSERYFDNDFERFLQQQVKQHRMYPSDAVWKGIYQQMHGDKKWPGLYFIAILIVAALSVCTIFMDATPVLRTAQPAQKEVATVNHLDPAAVTNETVKYIEQHTATATSNYIADVTVPAPVTANVAAPGIAMLPQEVANYIRNAAASYAIAPPSAEEWNDAYNEATLSSALFTGNTATRNIDHRQQLMLKKLSASARPDLSDLSTPLIVSGNKKFNRWQYQVYITPATNFKRTVDTKATNDQFNGPTVTTAGMNASEVIRYTPGMGIEFGIGALYGVNRNLRIKAGLQYNVRQYNLEAYDGAYEVSSIPLADGNSLPTLAKYRSYNANYNDALLLNKYHQVSIPIGVEYSFINRDRVALNIGATLQPTYTFSESAYLLTADYKSYADGTSMIRRWNLNSSVEATLSVNVGDFQWKFGPQFRYQHLSTFSNKYPIKEYLIDYGFKIGFTKTLK